MLRITVSKFDDIDFMQHNQTLNF